MNSPTIKLSAAAVLALALVGPQTAMAHHSFATFDMDKTVTLKGTVKNFEWRNPHAALWLLTAPGGKTKPVLWQIELPTSPGNLGRMGWTKRDLNPGDQVIVDVGPRRDGSASGSLKRATNLTTGKVLEIRGAAVVDAPKTP